MKRNNHPPLPRDLWAASLLIVFLFVFSLTPAMAQNLLTNPGFESPYNAVYTGSPGVVSGVAANGWADNSTWISGATVADSQDTSVYHSGLSSQKIVVSSGSAQYQQTPNFQAGRYTASIYVKALAPTWISLALEQSGGSFTNYAVTCFRATTSWQQVTVTGITPATPGKVLISIAQPGTVWLDDASLVFNGTNPAPLTLSPPATSIPTTYFGFHPQQLAALGYGSLLWPGINFGIARSHDSAPKWAQIETSNGVYDWVNLDNFVNQAIASGQKVIYTISETPQWATTDTNVDQYNSIGGDGVPSNMSYWTTFITALVNRYKGKIAAYEIWNEPNLGWWDGTAAQMAQMETTAAPIIHSTDPSALVISAPYSITNNAQNFVACEQYLAAGGGSTADVLAFHLYDPSPEDDISCITALKSLFAAYGYSSKPIWNTETGWGDTAQSGGWNDAPMSETVAFLPRAYVLEWAMGVTNFNWYGWSKDGNVGVTQDANSRYTVLTPGATSYQQVVSWLKGATMTSCSMDSNGNWVARTASGSVTGWIVWNNDTSYSYPVPTGATTKYDTAGNITSLSGVSTVTVNSTPIYMTNAPVPPAPVTTTINLSNYYNTIGITNDSAPTLGNLDGSGFSYSAQAIGSQSFSISGVPFTLGPFTNSTNNVIGCMGQTIVLPAGKYSTLYLLGCGVQSDQLNMPLTVYYTNGTSSIYTLNLSNWGSNTQGNTVAKSMTYRNGPSGQNVASVNIFEYALPLNNTRTVASITLPLATQQQTKILAATLVPTATPPASTTAVSSSLNPSTYGTSVTFTATVTGSSPTGTVQFAIDGTNSGSPVALSSGHATYSASTLSVGTHTVGVTYSGDTNNAGSSGTLSPVQTVNTAPSGVSANLSSYYNSIGITNDSAPTLGNIDGSGYSYSAQGIGSQSFNVGSVPFTLGPFTNSTNNVITCSGQTVTLPSGHYSTLYLLGCAVNSDQTGQAFTVNYTSGSPTIGSLSLSNWGSNGQSNTIAKAMTYRNGPSGSVTFTNDIYEYVITLNSANTTSTLVLPSNSQVKILAATLIPSGSLTSTTTAVSSSLNPSTYGTSVTFMATVTGNSPTGTVQFAIDGTNAGSPVALSSGHATYATSSLSVATHTVTAIYSGDTNNSGSNGTLSPVQTVNKVNSSTAVSSSLNPSTSGTSVTFTATVTGNSPTGTVQFAIDGTNVGSPVALSSGHATYATSTLSVGTHTVTAAYGGNTNNNGSSGTLSPVQTVNSAGSTVSLSSYYNCIGITNDSAPTLGNIDGSGYSYSAQGIGSQSFNVGSVPFTLGPFTNSANNVITCSGQTVTLPSGHYSTLYLLGCAVNSDQTGQAFTVNYTSGSPTIGSLSLSNWGSNGQSNTIAKAMTYRNGPSGSVTFTNDIYEYTLTLNSANTTSTLVLPSNSQVKVLAATLVP